jgi:sterol desaturase/sphingolipid hydroxylase (fatty acid hydroxylase superfamily)
MMIPYWASLIAVSLVFVATEHFFPWRRQPLRRQGFGTDLLYLGFNGHLLAILLAPAAGQIAHGADSLVVPLLGKSHVAVWPLWAQFLLAFFAVDLIQWGVHNLMHRVPWLWSFHRVHHSILAMDWLGSMRFHWLEIVVYRSFQYVPLLLLGFHWQILAWLAVFSTAMGHFNHANLRVPMGPLRYLLNHPTMHIWHHDMALHGRAGCNFGINLSLWDWLFGTAYMPDEREQPGEIGFPGVARFPRRFWSQQVVPFSTWWAANRRRIR